MYQQGSKYVIYIIFFSFKIVILGSHTFKHCELKFKLHIACPCSKLFKFKRNQKDFQIPEAIDFFENWFTNKPKFQRTWETIHQKLSLSGSANPMKEFKFFKSNIEKLHLIPTPYNKWSQRTILQICAPHKNSSPMKSKVFFFFF